MSIEEELLEYENQGRQMDDDREEVLKNKYRT